jgi:hypothetical protein
MDASGGGLWEGVCVACRRTVRHLEIADSRLRSRKPVSSDNSLHAQGAPAARRAGHCRTQPITRVMGGFVDR